MLHFVRETNEILYLWLKLQDVVNISLNVISAKRFFKLDIH